MANNISVAPVTGSSCCAVRLFSFNPAESAWAEWLLPLHNGPQTFVSLATWGGHVEREV
ncbi:hypothetical protein PAMP_006295 [Pampus punctatissimus]